jgi:ferrochelatase
LEPYTEPTVRELARQGVKSLDIVCPGFVSDCLETLEEIAMEVQEAFHEEGGGAYSYIPCLNDDPQWISALGELAHQHLAGWPTLAAPDEQALATSRAEAVALGRGLIATPANDLGPAELEAAARNTGDAP